MGADWRLATTLPTVQFFLSNSELSFLIFTIHHNRHRPIIEQLHLHVRAKLTRPDGFAQINFQLADHFCIKRDGDVRFAGADIVTVRVVMTVPAEGNATMRLILNVIWLCISSQVVN